MTEMVARIDDWGLPAWIGLMVIGFIIFWPIGLGILAYLIWSGRMTCRARKSGRDWRHRVAGKWERKMERWGIQAKTYTPTGNRAFDEYRDDTLRRLEEEAEQFQSFLDRLRMAKDKSEFEQFMADRQAQSSANSPRGTPNQPGDTPFPA